MLFILGGLLLALFGVEIIGRSMRWGEQRYDFPPPPTWELSETAKQHIHRARLRADTCERVKRYRWN